MHFLTLPLTLALALVALAGLFVRLRVAARARCEAARLADASTETLRDVFETLPHAGKGDATILDDNNEAWATRWQLLSDARHTIDVVTFILSADAFGVSFLGLLLQKQKEGVRVRLLVDWFGTFQGSHAKPWRELLQPLVDAGADVRVYNEIRAVHVSRFLRRLSVLPVVACDHDKVIIVDRRVAITGGRNVAQEYFADPDDDARVFFDKDIAITSSRAVTGLADAFERELESTAATRLTCKAPTPCEGTLMTLAASAMDRWLKAPAYTDADVDLLHASDTTRAALVAALVSVMTHESRCPMRGKLADHVQAFAKRLVGLPRLCGALDRARVRAQTDTFRTEMRTVDSCSEANCTKNKLNEALLRLLAASKRTVWIQSPYVVLTERALFALENAARRGVQITLLTNSAQSSDNAFSQAVFLRQWPRLLERIPGLRLFAICVERNEHSKAAVFDDEVALVGTYNLDVVSAGINGELAVAMHGPEAASRVAASMRARIAAGAPVVREYRVRPSRRGNRRPSIVFGPEHHVRPQTLLRTKLLTPFAAILSSIPRVAEP